MANHARPLPRSHTPSSDRYASPSTPKSRRTRSDIDAATPSRYYPSDGSSQAASDVDREWEFRTTLHRWIPDRLPVLGVAARVNLGVIRWMSTAHHRGARMPKHAKEVKSETDKDNKSELDGVTTNPDEGKRPRRTVAFDNSE